MATLTKISGLPELTTPRDEDLIQVIDDPSGTPANKYMTLNRVSDLTNVINYGADPTGVADSTAGIQAAIDAAAATVVLGVGAETGVEGVNWGHLLFICLLALTR